MKQILDAILADAHLEPGFADIAVPESYKGVTVHKDEEQMFAGMPTREKDPRKSLHLDEVPVPELGPGEALVAVMASAINYNTVWTSLFEPVSTFGFLSRYGRSHELAKRHDLPYHVVGSDLAGVVLRTGPGVSAWKPGDEVVAHCLSVELENPAGHNDTMMDPGAADLGLRDQLRRPGRDRPGQVQPADGQARAPDLGGGRSPGLVNSTAYRQLVSRNGAGMKQGDIVLIWGASGGLGSYATQYGPQRRCHRRSAWSPATEKAEICRKMGAELIIDRNAEGYKFWKDRAHPGPQGVAAVRQADPRAHRRRGRRHRLRAPGPRDVRRQRLRRPARAARSSPARRHRATCTSTTTATSG